MEIVKTIQPRRCPHCGYIWTPRIPDPKRCPQCKQALAKTDIQAEREKLRNTILIDIKPIQGDEGGFNNCKRCSKPAPFRVDENGEHEYLCKDCLLERIMRTKQPADQTEAAKLWVETIVEN